MRPSSHRCVICKLEEEHEHHMEAEDQPEAMQEAQQHPSSSLAPSAQIVEAPQGAEGGQPNPPQSPPYPLEGCGVDQHAEVNLGGPGNLREGGPAVLLEEAAAQPPAGMLPSMHTGHVVAFLLQKYRSRALVSKAQLLRQLFRGQPERFPDIFSRACECMQVVFGIEVWEADPQAETYELTLTLGITYNGMRDPDCILPKTGLLFIVLAIILVLGNCAPGEVLWAALRVMDIYPGREHFIYGDPWHLLTYEWVQEEYILWFPVPNRHPLCFQFRWGPRAHQEVCKLRLLTLWVKVNSTEPTSFLHRYEERFVRDICCHARARLRGP